jgi:hypothetical protein
MKKTARSTNSTSSVRGPIARKVIASARQYLQEKVTNIADWRGARVRAEDYQKTVISRHKLAGYDPLHGLDVYAQNQLSVLIEQMIDLPMLDRLADAYAEAREEYMPTGPPISPLTTSYVTCRGSFYLCSSGAKKETLCMVATDFCKFRQIDEGLITQFFSFIEKDWLAYFKRNLPKMNQETKRRRCPAARAGAEQSERQTFGQGGSRDVGFGRVLPARMAPGKRPATPASGQFQTSTGHGSRQLNTGKRTLSSSHAFLRRMLAIRGHCIDRRRRCWRAPRRERKAEIRRDAHSASDGHRAAFLGLRGVRKMAMRAAC